MSRLHFNRTVLFKVIIYTLAAKRVRIQSKIIIIQQRYFYFFDDKSGTLFKQSAHYDILGTQIHDLYNLCLEFISLTT